VSSSLHLTFTLSKDEVLQAITNHLGQTTTEIPKKLIIFTAPAVNESDRVELVDRAGGSSAESVQVLSAKPTEVSSMLHCLRV
jgi:hypothetical protein